MKVLIFGVLLLLGIANQFILHPRIEALRVLGDQRSLRTILARQFPALVAVELLLGLTVLFVAPFRHGSARNQAYQAQPSVYQGAAADSLPKLPAKQASASTWLEGTGETIAVGAVMIAAYRLVPEGQRPSLSSPANEYGGHGPVSSIRSSGWAVASAATAAVKPVPSLTSSR